MPRLQRARCVGFPFNAVETPLIGRLIAIIKGRRANKRGDDLHKRTINPPFHSSPLLSSFAFLHFYSRYSRGNQPLFRLDVFGILSFMRIKEEREREREVLTRHELDSRGRIWEGEWEGMDKRNLDLGWIIERN